MSHAETARIYHLVLDAFASGDIDTLERYIAPDVVWHLPGEGALSGDHRGRDSVITLVKSIVEATNGTFRIEPIAIAASGNHGFSWQRVTATREGAELDELEALVFEVRDGKIAEVWHRPEQDKLDAFLS